MITRILHSFVATAVLLSAGAVFAQTAVLQGGPWQPGHAPMYVGSGSQPIVQDSGTSAGGPNGVGLSELGITSRAANGVFTPPYANSGNGPNKEHFCLYDAPTTNASGYHAMCLDPNASSGGLISYGAFGGAANLPLKLSINGSTADLPPSSAAANTVYAGPTSGASAAPTFRALVGADLPLPAASTLGGVKSLSAPTHNFLTGIGTDGVPTTGQPDASDLTGTLAIANGGSGQTTANAALNAFLPSQTGNSGKVLSTNGTSTSWASVAGSGTVTSVGLSLPSMFTVSGSPVTASGTLTGTLASQTMNTFLAAPDGTTGTPTFRVIATGDLPTIPVAKGGTAVTSASGTALDNITGFSGTGIVRRTGAGTYTQGTAITGSEFGSQSANLVYASPDGSSGNPTFRAVACADLPAGARCLLNTLTASSSATLSDTTSITSTYRYYDIELDNITPASASAFTAVFYVGGSYVSTNYNSFAAILAGAYTNTTSTTNVILASSVNTTTVGFSGLVTLVNPSSANAYKHFFGQIANQPSGESYLESTMISGYLNNTTAISGIQFKFGTGNIASGVIKIYGHN